MPLAVGATLALGSAAAQAHAPTIANDESTLREAQKELLLQRAAADQAFRLALLRDARSVAGARGAPIPAALLDVMERAAAELRARADGYVRVADIYIPGVPVTSVPVPDPPPGE